MSDEVLRSGLQFWASANLPSLLKSITRTTSSLTSNHASSVTSRKSLGAATKAFKTSAAVKSLAESPILSPLKAILKLYQDEIDGLHQRCTQSDKAFHELAAALQDAPDPAELINRAATAATAASSSDAATSPLVEQLQQDIREYEEELANVKDQSVTIRKLQERIYQLESNEVATSQKLIDEAIAENQESADSKVQDALARESSLLMKIEALEVERKAERAGQQALNSQLLDSTNAENDREAAWSAQKSVLISEIQKINEQYHDTSRERDEARMKLEVLSQTKGNAAGDTAYETDASTLQAYESEVAELTVLLAKAKESARAAANSNESNERAHAVQMETLAASVQVSQARASPPLYASLRL